MKDLARFRPSPALIVALAALVIAATGIAVAHPGESSKAKPVTAKKAK